MKPLPLIAPNPPRLSELGDRLRRVEASGVHSNNGPEVRGFEADATAQLFGGHGASLAVNNATLGLMIAIRQAAGFATRPNGYALMPALTFAATAQSAAWAGLTPLICDVDPDDWGACPAAEERSLRRYAGQVRVVIPYATFGNAVEADGIGCGRYFSPHLGEQPWFRASATIDATPVADRVCARMISLPITDAMTTGDVARVVETLARACRTVDRIAPMAKRPAPVASVVVVGGGPAGTALLTAATKRGLLPQLARGLVMVERDAGIGNGRLGRYAITSDSTAQTFLTAVKDNAHPELAALVDHPAGRAVASHAGSLGVPLVEVGPLLRATGERLAGIVRANGGQVLTGHEALEARRVGDGLWSVRLKRSGDGVEFDQPTRNIVIATGGHQPLDRLAAQRVAGGRLLDVAGDRLIQSDDVLTLGGFEKVADLLSTKRDPRIVVVGGSTSALTTVALLLKGRPPLPLGAGAVTLLHRRPLRPFYHSVEAAHAEGFTDFGADDICPVSGFVYRLAGFRLEARDLVQRMLGIDGRVPDPRVALHRIAADDDAAARAHLERADLVIAALGYRPFALPVADVNGAPIALRADTGREMVDRHCRMVDASGAALPGLYGIGLAAGFVPWGALGGEASFSGQANGLWLWQNDVGLMIVDQLLRVEARAAA